MQCCRIFLKEDSTFILLRSLYMYRLKIGISFSIMIQARPLPPKQDFIFFIFWFTDFHCFTGQSIDSYGNRSYHCHSFLCYQPVSIGSHHSPLLTPSPPMKHGKLFFFNFLFFFIYFFLILCSFVVLFSFIRDATQASNKLGKHSTTELYPRPFFFFRLYFDFSFSYPAQSRCFINGDFVNKEIKVRC